MFVMTHDPRMTVEVRIELPGAEPQSFDATFRVLPDDEANGFGSDNDGVRAFLESALIGLDGIVTDDGKPMEYGDGLRNALLRFAHVRQAMMRAYFAGVYKAKSGN